jgi:hypothetical protein
VELQGSRCGGNLDQNGKLPFLLFSYALIMLECFPQYTRFQLISVGMGSGSHENSRPFKVGAMEKEVRALHHA